MGRLRVCTAVSIVILLFAGFLLLTGCGDSSTTTSDTSPGRTTPGDTAPKAGGAARLLYFTQSG